jgi:anthranilate phosphoribosyltransferase
MTPEDFGIPVWKMDAILGGDAAENARIIETVFRGDPGPRRDVVLLNTAPALVAAGAVSSWKEGIRLAADSIDSGKAMKKLEEVRKF